MYITTQPLSQNLKPLISSEWLIQFFIFLEQENKSKPFFDKHIPDGQVAMVFNFKGNVHYYNEGIKMRLPDYFLITPLQKSLFIESQPPFDTMVVVFHTTRFSRKFKLDFNKMDPLPFKSAESFIPNQLFVALSNLKNAEERKALFEMYILEKVGSGEYSDDLIDDIFNQIIMSNGTVQVQKIVCDSDIDPRTFRRKFLSRAGMNAKTLCRITRFHYLWSNYLSKGVADIQNMIFEGGFYDQSHLINDFKDFIGESPKAFFTRDQALLKLISGK